MGWLISFLNVLIFNFIIILGERGKETAKLTVVNQINDRYDMILLLNYIVQLDAVNLNASIMREYHLINMLTQISI